MNKLYFKDNATNTVGIVKAENKIESLIKIIRIISSEESTSNVNLVDSLISYMDEELEIEVKDLTNVVEYE